MQNNQITRVNKIDKVLFFVIALLFLVLSYINLNAGFMRRLDEETGASKIHYYYLFSLVCFAAYAFFHKNKHLSIFFWVFWGYFVLFYLASTNLSVNNLFSAFVLTFWTFCYRFGIRLANTNKNIISYFIRVLLFVVIIPLSIYCIFLFFSSELLTNQVATDAFFMIVAYFPFVLMMEKNRFLKIIMYIVFLILVAISIKRSIILGFIACSIIYILNTDNKKLISKWYFWFLIIAITILGYFFYDVVSETLYYRFSRLEEDGGTGRDVLYKVVIDSFMRSDGFHVLFGHGFQSVRMITPNHKMAHNDLLEILYDFGFLGFSIYFLFLLSFIKKAIRTRKHTNKTIYSAFVASFVLFIFLSSFNCIIYSTMIVSPIMLSLGILRGSLENNLS